MVMAWKTTETKANETTRPEIGLGFFTHRLLIQTTIVSGTVWQQVFTGGYEPQFGERVVIGIGDGSPE